MNSPGRPQTEKTKKKISASVKSWQEKTKKENPAKWKLYREKLAEGTRARYQHKKENRLKYLSDTPFDRLGPGARREKILLDQNNHCAKCNGSEWFGVPLTLEIDHVNGNHQDNHRDNLVALCPNCHSITPTWRGKNKNSCKRVSDTDALEALRNEPSIRQALIRCGLSPRGGNYKRFTNLKNTLAVP